MKTDNKPVTPAQEKDELDLHIKIGRSVRHDDSPTKQRPAAPFEIGFVPKRWDRTWRETNRIAGQWLSRLVPPFNRVKWGQMETAEGELNFNNIPEKQPLIGMQHTLMTVLFSIFALLVVINVPLSFEGKPIARTAPDPPSILVREGLLFKTDNRPEIYILSERLTKHLIVDRAAFELYDFEWQAVHMVDDAFVAQFQDGEPLYALTACIRSPHVYALEDGKKRWIEDFPAYDAQTVLESRFIRDSCADIAKIPLGEPLQTEAGE